MIPFKLLYELAYVGNVGIQELMTFYQRATSEQVDLLEDLLKSDKISRAIRLIEKVTGVKLQESHESKNIDKSKVAAQRAMDREKKRKAETGRGDPAPRRDSKPKSEAALPLGNEPLKVPINWVLTTGDSHLIMIPAGTELPKELEIGDVLSVIDNKFKEQYRAIVSGDRLTTSKNARIYPIKNIP